jgi:hypothetical protein
VGIYHSARCALFWAAVFAYIDECLRYYENSLLFEFEVAFTIDDVGVDLANRDSPETVHVWDRTSSEHPVRTGLHVSQFRYMAMH